MITRFVVFLQPVAKYLLITWVLTILIVSSVPFVPVLKIHTPKADIRIDYFIHFCEYGLLAFLAFLTFTGRNFKITLPKFMLITLFVICFALFDEFHQKLIPGRAFNTKDIISNLTGIAAALLFSLIIFRVIAKNIKKQ